MSTKYFCDYCEKEITRGTTGFTIVFYEGGDSTTVTVCHDCYWKIQGFVNSIIIIKG
jgi:hypothetical protein